MASPIGFAILGTGDAAKSHAAALQECPDSRLIACLSRRPEGARAFAAQFGCRGETNLDAILTDASVDAAIVATEPELHDLAIPVARSGRHVLIEKPLAASLDQATAIVQACSEAKVNASVVSQRRFDAAFEKVRSYLHDEVVGSLLFAEFTLLASRSAEYFASGNGWRRGPEGGITMNLLIHAVDGLLCLLGRVRSVQAYLAPAPAKGSPDRRASILLTFESGIHAIVRGSTEFDRTWGQTLTITGTKGTLLMQNDDVRAVRDPLGAEGRLTRVRRLAVDLLPRLAATSNVVRQSPLSRQIQDFVTAIQTLSRPAVTLEDGLAALRVVCAAHQSHATGSAIRLPVHE